MTRTWGFMAIAWLCAAAAVYGQSTQERNFVSRMWLADMAEIELGQIGEQRAASPEVKAFASAIVSDAKQSHPALRTLAQRLGVRRPAELDNKHKAIAERLLDLKGPAFDRAFMRAMVDEHRDVARETKKVAGSRVAAIGTGGGSGAMTATDYAAMVEPLIERHLARAEQIERRLAER